MNWWVFGQLVTCTALVLVLECSLRDTVLCGGEYWIGGCCTRVVGFSGVVWPADLAASGRRGRVGLRRDGMGASAV